MAQYLWHSTLPAPKKMGLKQQKFRDMMAYICLRNETRYRRTKNGIANNDHANLLCAQANSASYPQRDGKWVVAHGLRGEGLVR